MMRHTRPNRPLRSPLLLRSVVRCALLAAAVALVCALPVRRGHAAEFGDPAQPMKAYWWKGQIVVEVLPQPNEGYIQIARRVMADPAQYPDIVAFNRKRPVMAGRPVAFPVVTLTPELRGLALRAMYPEDEMTERGWAHRVTDPLENLIQLSWAYTGSPRYFKELARYNDLRNPDVLRQGDEIVFPLKWLPDEMGFRPAQLKGPLTVEQDQATGALYADYALQPGETLYSVLIRFTDRERAEEINRMSGILVRLNELGSPERARAGQRLRIPVEWISEDYYDGARPPPPEPELTPPAPAPPKRSAGAFGPLHVIVDAGHGGSDPGAVYGKRGQPDHVFEHEMVYDISLRLLDLLQAKGHETYQVVRDPEQPKPVDSLPTDRMGRERVLVDPPYRMDSSNVAVNMRVFFINALYRELTEHQGVPPENVLLVSIHGDALAATLRGAMVYYPDHRLRAREFHPRGRVYTLRQQAVPSLIRFDPDDNREAQERSRDFGELVLNAFRAQQLGVSGRKAIRPYYYRQGERTLPAVLRYSRVPVSVLVEVANLNNHHDRAYLLQPANRQRVARALAAAVEAYRNRLGEHIARHSSS